MALTDDELTPLKRMVALRAERMAALEAARAETDRRTEAVRAAQADVRTAQDAAAAAFAVFDQADLALQALRAVVAGTADELDVARMALQLAPEVAPDLLDGLTKTLAEREAAAAKAEPAVTDDVAEVLAAVERRAQ